MRKNIISLIIILFVFSLLIPFISSCGNKPVNDVFGTGTGLTDSATDEALKGTTGDAVSKESINNEIDNTSVQNKDVNNFTTPEAAIEHFVNAIKNNDVKGALETCAIDESSEGYDFIGTANRLKVLMPTINLAPSNYKMYIDINKLIQAASIGNQIKLFVYSFFTTEGLDGKPVVITSDNQATDFVSAVDPQGLSKLILKEVGIPDKSIMYSEKNIENFNKHAQLYGADEQTERVVLYELNGEYYCGGFQIMRYKNNWKIISLYSNLAGQSPYGTVTKITQVEFEQILQ